MATPTTEIPAPSPATSSHPHDPVAQTLALIQPWIDYVPRPQRRLGIFISIALLAHVAAFFFIRIDTTRAELRHQTRTHVTVESAQTAARASASGDGFWNQLSDPRLFLMPINSTVINSSDMPAMDVTSINSSFGAQPFPSAAQAEDFPFIHQVVVPLEQRVEDALQPARQPFAYQPAARPIATRTTGQWDATLASRNPSALPDLPSPISDTELIPTELQIAVNADGTVEHAMVEQSCGSGRLDLDQQAIIAARKVRFQRSDKPGLTWGRLTVFWNYSAHPREEVVPTPPSAP